MNRYILLILLCFMTASPAFAATERYVRIAAGDVASGLFDQAGLLAGELSHPNTSRCSGRDCSSLIAAAQASASARAALSNLRAGTVELALVPAEEAYNAFSGRNQRAWPELRSIARIETKPLLILTRPDQRFASLMALTGKRIVTGARGTDSATRVRDLLASIGLSSRGYREVSAEGLANRLAMVTNGTADAAVLLGDVLDAPTLALIAEGQVKILVPTKAEIDRALIANPYLQNERVRIGGSSFVSTIAASNVLVVRSDMPVVDMAVVMTHLWPTENKTLRPIELGPGVDVTPGSAIQNLPVPLHAGAEAFYKAHDVIKEDNSDASAQN